MKKAIPLCGVLLAVTATVASAAAGVNIRWNSCLGDGGVFGRAFACNSNTAFHVLAASFVLPTDLPQAAAVGVRIVVSSASPMLPEWWQFTNPGSCRQTALSAAAQDGPSCPDWAQGQASVSIAGYNLGAGDGPNTAEIYVVNAVSLDQVQNLGGGQEYGVVQLRITTAKTAGTGSCVGCLIPACIVCQTVDMFSAVNNGALHILMSGPSNGTDSHYVAWQGGCREVTLLRSSWGGLKSLYR